MLHRQVLLLYPIGVPVLYATLILTGLDHA